MEGLNNSQVEKKNQEYKSVLTLISHLPNSSDYHCKNEPNQEEPDFIVTNGKRKIGIEVVSAFLTDNTDYRSRKESTIRKSFHRCLKQFNCENEKTPLKKDSLLCYYPLYTISVPTDIMSTDDNIEKAELEREFRQFLESKEKVWCCENGITITKDSNCLLYGYLKVDIVYTVGRMPIYAINGEMADYTQLAQIDKRHPLSASIYNKSESLKTYKTNLLNKDVNEWWLCISLPHSSQIGFAEYKISDDIQHGFDKIYLVDNVINRACELNYVNIKENKCLNTKI